LFIRFVGLVLIAFAATAALSPPLSGLETLPAIGSVLVALALILEDALILLIGMIIGTGGIVLFVGVGAAAVRVIRHLI
jgi:hypothetical protein